MIDVIFGLLAIGALIGGYIALDRAILGRHTP